MTKTERLIPLTAQDIEKLKGRKSGGTGCFWIVAVVIIAVTTFLYFLIGDIFNRFSIDEISDYSFSAGVLVLPVGLAFIILAYLIMSPYAGKANKDLQAGIKKVVTAPVLKKFTEDLDPSNRTNFAIKTAYMVDIDGTAYDVKEEEYQKYEIGMTVEVHTAPHSREFLGIYDPTTGKLLTEELL